MRLLRGQHMKETGSDLNRTYSFTHCYIYPAVSLYLMRTRMETSKITETHVEIVVEKESRSLILCNIPPLQSDSICSISIIKQSLTKLLTKLHAGYFRISLSLCSQALLWKILRESANNSHAFRRVFRQLPSTAYILLWSSALVILLLLSFLYLLKCLFQFKMVKAEFLDHVGVNYLFAPWISWLLLLQSSPFITPKSIHYQVLWWAFAIPIVVLDVKIYGQWLTKGKRFLSMVANPTSQLTVISNLVAARAAAEMELRECALCMFSVGMTHYLVLFVTLYQRLSGGKSLPIMLRPVFFLFIAAPSMGSLAWGSIVGSFDDSAKMLFFLSLFLFLSLITRPMLFKKAMTKFNVAWWAYSFPLTIQAVASVYYAQEVEGTIAHVIMLLLSAISLLVPLALITFAALNSNIYIIPSYSS